MKLDDLCKLEGERVTLERCIDNGTPYGKFLGIKNDLFEQKSHPNNDRTMINVLRKNIYLGVMEVRFKGIAKTIGSMNSIISKLKSKLYAATTVTIAEYCRSLKIIRKYLMNSWNWG